MIRVSVVSTKDIVRKIPKIAIIILILISVVGIVKASNKYLSKTELSMKMAISYLTEEIPAMGDTNITDISKVNPKQLLDKELMLSEILVKEENPVNDENMEYDDNQETTSASTNADNDNAKIDAEQTIETNNENQQEIQIEKVEENLKTEVVNSSYKQTHNYEIDGVKIKNESKYDLNTLNLSSNNSKIENKNIIIFHTHTCESYTQTQSSTYVESGNYRTTDLNYSVAKVGDVMQTYLTSYGFNVIHDKTYHDYPAYNGSYGRSLKTVSAILQKNPKTQIIIDLHRDAMSDESYAPKVKIGDEYVSQIMFVIGTDGSGLEHDNWKKNLEFAIKVQKKGNEMYPGLFKPIIVRNARYNQHLSSAATIIEFGATGNTLEECEGAAKYLSKVLDEVIK
ncbi:MAG: stage II sporulation protein P [Clostridia bacterium]|nr:stage II sporulation protein P [Clostridia bacterium]